MTTLETIIHWAESDLPAWQSDAVRRLLSQGALSDDDKNLSLIHNLTLPTNREV